MLTCALAGAQDETFEQGLLRCNQLNRRALKSFSRLTELGRSLDDIGFGHLRKIGRKTLLKLYTCARMRADNEGGADAPDEEHERARFRRRKKRRAKRLERVRKDAARMTRAKAAGHNVDSEASKPKPKKAVGLAASLFKKRGAASEESKGGATSDGDGGGDSKQDGGRVTGQFGGNMAGITGLAEFGDYADVEADQVRRWRSRRLVALKYVFGSLVPAVMFYYAKTAGRYAARGRAVCRRS